MATTVRKPTDARSSYGQWHADWWLSCGVCGDEFFIDGGPADGTRKSAVRYAKELGWKMERARGYVCPNCTKGRT